MKKLTLRTAFIALLSCAAIGASLPIPVSAAIAASQDKTLLLSGKLGFEQGFQPTMNGLIREMKKFGMFSGSKNRDTEELRLRLTRERLTANQPEILGKAHDAIAASVSDADVDHLMGNLSDASGKIADEKASQTRELVVKLYRDAIFNAIMAATLPVQEEADRIKAAGGELK